MSTWQRKARLLIAIAAVALAIVVAFAFRHTPPPAGVVAVAPTDPKALVEGDTGQQIRFNLEKEQIRIQYDTITTYPDGPSKMHGVKVTTVRAGGRTFEVTGKYAEVSQNETNISMVGDVHLKTSDGMEARAERATYTEADALLRAPGPIEFTRGRLSGSGVGLTYAKNIDVLTIHERVVVRVAPGETGTGASEISSGTAEFSRVDHTIRFTGDTKVVRGGQTVEADFAVARLSADDQRLEIVELRGNSRMTTPESGVGGLRSMRGRNIDLKYQPDGETLERALVTGDAVAHVGGERNISDRVIAAGTLDAWLAPDGSTPTALTARDNVELTIPGEQGRTARSIRAQTLESQGEPGRGLTRAHFGGGVQFTERGADVNRSAQSGTLDVTLAPGLSEIEEARFAQAVRFEEGALRASAARARYVLTKGTLELTGTEPAIATPRVINDRISVDSTRIDITLAGPIVKAAGSVKSELKPPRKDAPRAADTRIPSMFKDDQLVAATAGELLYDGPGSKATYSGNAQLWQGETSIKAATIVLDEKSGDLTATGSVSTSIALDQETKDKAKERVQTIGSSNEFRYEEEPRRATYLGDARINGPQRDMTAAKIELYLNPAGDQLERAEAYDAVTLREGNWEIKGARMTYVAAADRYVVTGAPVVIKNECGSETTGKRVTYDKRADTIVIDGSQQTRTQTRGGANCP